MYVRVNLRSSLLLRVSQAASHSLALLVLLWVDLAVSLRIAIGLLVVVSFLRSTRGEFPQPRAIVFIDGAPRLLFQERTVEVELQEYVYCTTLVLVLHCKWRQLPRLPHKNLAGFRSQLRNLWPFDCSHLCILILPDSSSVDDRRRLRTLLRWHALIAREQGDDARSGQRDP